MNSEEIPCPKYDLGDTIKFNRSKQEGDLFKDESDLVGTIGEIDILMSTHLREIRYFTEHDDHISPESIQERMIPESKVRDIDWYKLKTSSTDRKKWKNEPLCIACNSDREDFICWSTKIDDLIPHKFGVSLQSCADCKTPKRIGFSADFNGVGSMWTGLQRFTYNAALKKKTFTKVDKIKAKIEREQFALSAQRNKVDNLKQELAQLGGNNG